MSIKLELNYTKYLKNIYHVITKVNIIHILLLVLAIHLFIMSTPSEGFVFDEAHYVPAAKNTVNFIAANAEHTPLSKVVIGWSIQLFGDWWFGWRITPVIFSTLSVLVVYLIALQFMSKRYALFSAFFIGLDMLFFINGSIAILDGQAVFFGLLGVWLLLSERYATSALSFGLAVLSKETAVLILLGAVIYLVLVRINARKKLKLARPHFANWKPFLLFTLLFSGVVLGGVYAYDLAYKPSSQTVLQARVTATVIVDQNGTAITTQYSTTNITDFVYITNPVQHLIFAFNYYAGLAPSINPAPQDFRPAWSWALPLMNAFNPPQYFGVTVTGGKDMTLVSYLSQVNYPITIFIVPTLALCLYWFFKRKLDGFGCLYLGWLAGAYLPWILFSLFIQKMTFNYYFMYSVPVLSMGVPWFISKLNITDKHKLAFLLCLVVVVSAYFLYYFPLNLFRA